MPTGQDSQARENVTAAIADLYCTASAQRHVGWGFEQPGLVEGEILLLFWFGGLVVIYYYFLTGCLIHLYKFCSKNFDSKKHKPTYHCTSQKLFSILLSCSWSYLLNLT